MCLHLTRLDRSGGWEEEGGGALGSEVGRREERGQGEPIGYLAPGQAWWRMGMREGSQMNCLFFLTLEESAVFSPGTQFWSRSPFPSIEGAGLETSSGSLAHHEM